MKEIYSATTRIVNVRLRNRQVLFQASLCDNMACPSLSGGIAHCIFNHYREKVQHMEINIETLREQVSSDTKCVICD